MQNLPYCANIKLINGALEAQCNHSFSMFYANTTYRELCGEKQLHLLWETENVVYWNLTFSWWFIRVTGWRSNFYFFFDKFYYYFSRKLATSLVLKQATKVFKSFNYLFLLLYFTTFCIWRHWIGSSWLLRFFCVALVL